jgi:hypothetical protein
MKKSIYFTDSKGNRLAAVLSTPTPDKKNEIIILCHGLSSSKDSDMDLAVEKLLHSRHISI